MKTDNPQSLRARLTELAEAHGFQAVGVTDADLGEHEERLSHWLEQQYHGSMTYMASHGTKRSRPAQLVPGTLRLLSFRMDYTPGREQAMDCLNDDNKAYIARYALGRDYHKLMRKRLAKLAEDLRIFAEQEYDFRAFVDSAPVLERAIAEQSGLGWIGKNTMLINSSAGSWFFLGELFTNLPIPIDPPQSSGHCGTCTACMEVCPTKAFVKPWVLDARRCISYLTIESYDPIPLELRPLMGNRVFGCDDCQLFCPWNKFASDSKEPDFAPRHALDDSDLLSLFCWSEAEFLSNTEGSAIRRIGHVRWLRNLAVALGNAPPSNNIVAALQSQLDHSNDMVREHCQWAINQQQSALSTG